MENMLKPKTKNKIGINYIQHLSKLHHLCSKAKADPGQLFLETVVSNVWGRQGHSGVVSRAEMCGCSVVQQGLTLLMLHPASIAELLWNQCIVHHHQIISLVTVGFNFLLEKLSDFIASYLNYHLFHLIFILSVGSQFSGTDFEILSDISSQKEVNRKNSAGQKHSMKYMLLGGQASA